MLKKIQNTWNFILQKKKTANNVNLFSIKNNFLFSNIVGNSLVFFINSLKKLKIKKLKIINKIQFLLPYYRLFFIIFIIGGLSFLMYVFYFI